VADTIIVGCTWDSSDPDVYWFGISVDNGVENLPVPLTASSVVVVEVQQSGPTWHTATLAVAEMQPGIYAIRTVVPAALANGQERSVRLTIDGVLYGPWVFRFYGAGV
jgi:hypothetical protein